jgi:hypothetical protein
MHWSAMLTNEFAKLIVNGEGGSHENGLKFAATNSELWWNYGGIVWAESTLVVLAVVVDFGTDWAGDG